MKIFPFDRMFTCRKCGQIRIVRAPFGWDMNSLDRECWTSHCYRCGTSYFKINDIVVKGDMAWIEEEEDE